MLSFSCLTAEEVMCWQRVAKAERVSQALTSKWSSLEVGDSPTDCLTHYVFPLKPLRLLPLLLSKFSYWSQAGFHPVLSLPLNSIFTFYPWNFTTVGNYLSWEERGKSENPVQASVLPALLSMITTRMLLICNLPSRVFIMLLNIYTRFYWCHIVNINVLK